MTPPLLLGTHVSVAGGIHTAFDRATQTGCTTMQVFVKNASQWKAKPLGSSDIESYKTACAGATVSPVVAHAAYLINLCAVRPETLSSHVTHSKMSSGVVKPLTSWDWSFTPALTSAPEKPRVCSASPDR